MSRRERLCTALVLGSCIALAAVIALSNPRSEPRYHGRPLGYWLELYARNSTYVRHQIRLSEIDRKVSELPGYHDDLSLASSRVESATEVLREMGEEAIPYLERKIAYEPGAFERNLPR